MISRSFPVAPFLVRCSIVLLLLSAEAGNAALVGGGSRAAGGDLLGRARHGGGSARESAEPRRKAVSARAHRQVRRSAKNRHRRAAPAPLAAKTSAPRPHVECFYFEPRTATIEPFADEMARLMEPAATNDIAIQKLVQKRQRRPRRQRPEPALPAAPEPGTWLMMIIGFAAVGIVLRRRRASSDGIGGTRAGSG